MCENEKVTIVDGVILTDSLISRIKKWQDHDNEILKLWCNCISEAISNIALKLDYYENDDLRDIKDSMSNLAIIKKELKDLSKP